ncbi:MAG: hypothetical protein MI746_02230, partial [Pseudomonadales bacterium]|nr:hypothetical protein [Pseudomonadales bacterium]
LTKRHGAKAMQQYQKRNAEVQEQTADYVSATNRGDNRTIYKFDHNVLDASALEMNDHSIGISGITQAVNLDLTNPYADMCD